MEFRSSNTVGYAHYQGDIISNVSSAAVPVSSHGVQLTGGSTGGIVTAAGDETNIALNVLGKGSGPLILGAATAPVTILSSNLLIGSTGTLGLGQTSTGNVTIGSTNSTVFISGSTAPFSGFLRFSDTAVTTPNFATTNIMVMETTHVLAGLSTATVSGSPYFLLANAVTNTTDCSLVGAFIGTTAAANEVHCRWIKASTLTVGGSTCTVNFLVIRM